MKYASLLLFATLAFAQDYPSAKIANGPLKMSLYLPVPDKGSYQGTRFDWSGIITSLEFEGHQYFGQWYDKHDPKIHDAITGPVEAFDYQTGGPDYDTAPVGGKFLRLGVGVLKKVEEKSFQGFRTYDILDHGTWKVKQGKDWIEFTHRINDGDGHAYVYTKRIALVSGKPEFTISHSLKNTGTKPLDANQFNHNFFVIDGKPSGPGLALKFAFDPKPDNPLQGMLAVNGKELQYQQEFEKGKSVFTPVKGYSDSAQDYHFNIENRKTGAGVEIIGDRALERLNFWTIRTTLSPEPFIRIKADPGKTDKWTIRYRVYTITPQS